MKKIFFMPLVISALSFSALAADAVPSQALVTWSGVVPGVTAGSGYIISGLAGSELPIGSLAASKDGKFKSKEDIVLEGHEFDDNGVIGKLHKLDWYLTSSEVLIGGKYYDSADVVIKNHGQVWNTSDVLKEQDVLSLSVSQANTIEGIKAGEKIDINIVLRAMESL